MAILNFIITDAGKVAVAQTGQLGPVVLESIGVGSGAYIPSTGQLALQNETRRLIPDGTTTPVPGTIHFTITDDSTASYTVNEVGIFTSTGILFAVYSQTDPIAVKSAGAVMLLAIDLVLSNVTNGQVIVGNTGFTYSPASEANKGIAQVATQDEVDAGVLDTKMVTPKKLYSQSFINRFTLISRTDALSIPTGTTAQRPSIPSSGMIRMNTTTGTPEWYDVSQNNWTPFSKTSYPIDILVVGGGGGGGNTMGGGGGGGGFFYQASAATLLSSSVYTVTVGAGGAGAPTRSVSGTSGGNSGFWSFDRSVYLEVLGGGGGASWGAIAQSGGSGGGGLSTQAAGSGTLGQGNAGGAAPGGSISGSGGGGAGAVGTVGPSGPGGSGIGSSITGTSVFYAGGGGGGWSSDSTVYGAPSKGGAGGSGGGGNGGQNAAVGSAGAANTGGGGGGGGFRGADYAGGAGGSGIVILRYVGGRRGTGGTVTTAVIGGISYTIHTFTTSGYYTA